jgi:hypothetical protein
MAWQWLLESTFCVPYSVTLVSQNEHFTGIFFSVYFMDIMGDFVSMLQCLSDLYSSVSKWRLRNEWANNISGN